MLPHKTTLELLPTVAFLLNWIAIAARSKPDTRSYKGQQCPQKYHTVAGECHYEALKNKQYKQGLWRKGLIMKFILPLCLVLWSQCCTLMLDSNDEGVIKCTVRSHICLMLLLLLKLKWEYLHKNRKDRWHIIYMIKWMMMEEEISPPHGGEKKCNGYTPWLRLSKSNYIIIAPLSLRKKLAR